LHAQRLDAAPVPQLYFGDGRARPPPRPRNEIAESELRTNRTDAAAGAAKEPGESMIGETDGDWEAGARSKTDLDPKGRRGRAAGKGKGAAGGAEDDGWVTMEFPREVHLFGRIDVAPEDAETDAAVIGRWEFVDKGGGGTLRNFRCVRALARPSMFPSQRSGVCARGEVRRHCVQVRGQRRGAGVERAARRWRALGLRGPRSHRAAPFRNGWNDGYE
jgi:hypothetical protein